MKALRVKIPDANPSKSVFRFILLYKCAHVNLKYEEVDQLALVQLVTEEGEDLVFNRHMPSYEFELFHFRYIKFINSDEMFFNLSDFHIK